jgi:hypothetical protein
LPLAGAEPDADPFADVESAVDDVTEAAPALDVAPPPLEELLVPAAVVPSPVVVEAPEQPNPANPAQRIHRANGSGLIVDSPRRARAASVLRMLPARVRHWSTSPATPPATREGPPTIEHRVDAAGHHPSGNGRAADRGGSGGPRMRRRACVGR